MNRRDFLKYAAASGIAIAAPLTLSGETQSGDVEYSGPLFAVFNADGGWDTTMLMDPKGNHLNDHYEASGILNASGIAYAPNGDSVTGISNEAFFTKYAKELLVVNGMDMSTNNHAPNNRYMGTGKQKSFWASDEKTSYTSFFSLTLSVNSPCIKIRSLDSL